MKKKHLLILIISLLLIVGANSLAKECGEVVMKSNEKCCEEEFIIPDNELCLNLDYPSFGGFNLNEDQDINEVIAWGYSFIVAISGLAAFARLVSGGFKWLSSAGNQTKTAEAKETIKSALIGLVLVLSSFIIIKTINPELTTLILPDVSQVQQTPVDVPPVDVPPFVVPTGEPSCSISLSYILPQSEQEYLYLLYSFNNAPSADSESIIKLYKPYSTDPVASWAYQGNIDNQYQIHYLTTGDNSEDGTWKAEITTGECYDSRYEMVDYNIDNSIPSDALQE